MSPYDDPPWNIALEEALRSYAKKGSGFFVLYVNKRSVIVGRNQDCGLELSDAALRDQVPVFRRTTGGGAVYHDEGNLNWSFIVPGDLSLRPHLLSIIMEGLKGIGVAASEGERRGLYAGGKKLGGTASAAGGGALVFHGTLLVESDLGALSRYLRAHEKPGYELNCSPESRAGAKVLSVGSEVGRLIDISPGLRTARVKEALLRAVAQTAHTVPSPPGEPQASERLLRPAHLAAAAAGFSHQDWIYGRLSSRGIQPQSEAFSASRPIVAGKGKP